MDLIARLNQLIKTGNSLTCDDSSKSIEERREIWYHEVVATRRLMKPTEFVFINKFDGNGFATRNLSIKQVEHTFKGYENCDDGTVIISVQFFEWDK